VESAVSSEPIQLEIDAELKFSLKMSLADLEQNMRNGL
jgi:hypothetical protein